MSRTSPGAAQSPRPRSQISTSWLSRDCLAGGLLGCRPGGRRAAPAADHARVPDAGRGGGAELATTCATSTATPTPIARRIRWPARQSSAAHPTRTQPLARCPYASRPNQRSDISRRRHRAASAPPANAAVISGASPSSCRPPSRAARRPPRASSASPPRRPCRPVTLAICAQGLGVRRHGRRRVPSRRSTRSCPSACPSATVYTRTPCGRRAAACERVAAAGRLAVGQQDDRRRGRFVARAPRLERAERRRRSRRRSPCRRRRSARRRLAHRGARSAVGASIRGRGVERDAAHASPRAARRRGTGSPPAAPPPAGSAARRSRASSRTGRWRAPRRPAVRHRHRASGRANASAARPAPARTPPSARGGASRAGGQRPTASARGGERGGAPRAAAAREAGRRPQRSGTSSSASRNPGRRSSRVPCPGAAPGASSERHAHRPPEPPRRDRHPTGSPGLRRAIAATTSVGVRDRACRRPR